MNSIKKYILVVGLCLLSTISTLAQEGIGTNTPDKSAALEVSSSKRGLLIPRVNLSGTDDQTTIASPANSLLVYNLTASGTTVAGNKIEVGYYYWSQPSTKWVKLSTDVYTAGQGMILTGTEFSRTGLEEVTEGGKTGWRYIGMDDVKYDNTGRWATDLQYIPSSFKESKSFNYDSYSITYSALKSIIEKIPGFDFSQIGSTGDHSLVGGLYNIARVDSTSKCNTLKK